MHVAWKRFLLAWALTGPVAVLMLLHMTGIWHLHNGAWLELLLAAPVLAIAGAETFKKGFRTLWAKSPNMDALIAIGTLAAWSTGLMQLLGMEVESFAAVSAMIMAFHLTGRYLEARGAARPPRPSASSSNSARRRPACAARAKCWNSPSRKCAWAKS
jgi:Cu+-exporting ATPase